MLMMRRVLLFLFMVIAMSPDAIHAQIVGGGSGGGGGVTTDIQDGAGDSVMDAVNDAIRVNIIAGAGSGGTAADDNSAFTFGTTPVTPMGCVLDDAAPNAITENNVAAPRCTSARSLMVTGPVTNAGTFAVQVDGAALTALQLIDDVVHASDAAVSKSALIGCQFDDTAPGTTTENSVRAVRCSTLRELYGIIRDAAGNERGANVNASNELLTNANTELPAAAALADNTANPTVPGVAAFLMCYDGSTWDRCQGGVTDTDDGSVAASQVPSLVLNLAHAYNGTAWVRQGYDPCSGPKTHIAFSISSATTTELTPSLAGASTYYYVCSIDLVTAAANNVALVDDDSDNCGSVTSGLAGGVTAATGWNLAANGGLAKGNGTGTVFKTNGANRVVCLMTSAATQLSGSIQVVAAP